MYRRANINFRIFLNNPPVVLMLAVPEYSKLKVRKTNTPTNCNKRSDILI